MEMILEELPKDLVVRVLLRANWYLQTRVAKVDYDTAIWRSTYELLRGNDDVYNECSMRVLREIAHGAIPPSLGITNAINKRILEIGGTHAMDTWFSATSARVHREAPLFAITRRNNPGFFVPFELIKDIEKLGGSLVMTGQLSPTFWGASFSLPPEMSTSVEFNPDEHEAFLEFRAIVEQLCIYYSSEKHGEIDQPFASSHTLSVVKHTGVKCAYCEKELPLLATAYCREVKFGVWRWIHRTRCTNTP